VTGEYTSAIERDLDEMRRQYQVLLRDGQQWSLRELFSTPDCDIADYCRDFRPNRFGAQACRQVELFCRSHAIWLEAGGAQYNSMTPYLHPGAASGERMTIIGIFNAILFWLNDTVGREKFAHLSRAEQQQARTTVEQMCRIFEMRGAAADSAPVVTATAEFLAMLTQHAEPRWLNRFQQSTIRHLRSAIRDQNARTRGGLLSVADYADVRAQVSGMYPAIALCEFGRDDYVPWDRVHAAGLDTGLQQLRLLTVEIGALMNDVFSFEKECITDLADFNLIPICLLNTPRMTLADAVPRAAELVRDRFTRFRGIQAQVAAACTCLADADLAETVSAHVEDLVGCVQATWVWQIATLRYKGASIFTENRL
jgi:hypothetical protein